MKDINALEFTNKFFKDYFKLRKFIFKKPKIKTREVEKGIEVRILFQDDSVPNKKLDMDLVIPYKVYFNHPVKEIEDYHILFLNNYIHTVADLVIRTILESERNKDENSN